mmetsp:Transcript_16402/g.37518  ORF Transcript_16402/g.37518 Transcript_16402/m.37518 type:complete len:344 (-) Transcript_16402:830-1861(-)
MAAGQLHKGLPIWFDRRCWLHLARPGPHDGSDEGAHCRLSPARHLLHRILLEWVCGRIRQSPGPDHNPHFHSRSRSQVVWSWQVLRRSRIYGLASFAGVEQVRGEQLHVWHRQSRDQRNVWCPRELPGVPSRQLGQLRNLIRDCLPRCNPVLLGDDAERGGCLCAWGPLQCERGDDCRWPWHNGRRFLRHPDPHDGLHRSCTPQSGWCAHRILAHQRLGLLRANDDWHLPNDLLHVGSDLDRCDVDRRRLPHQRTGVRGGSFSPLPRPILRSLLPAGRLGDAQCECHTRRNPQPGSRRGYPRVLCNHGDHCRPHRPELPSCRRCVRCCRRLHNFRSNARHEPS